MGLERSYVKHPDPTNGLPPLADYLPILAKVASLTKCDLELRDRAQEGFFGLHHAYKNFNPARAKSFNGYIVKCVRGSILNANLTKSRTVRSPKSVTPAEMVSIKGIPDYADSDFNLKSPGKSPAEAAMMASDHAFLHEALKNLKPRTAEIVRLRYGMDGDPMTLDQIGAVFSLSRERIRQILDDTLPLLRRRIEV
jgi:RNA polymerase sigma factor (sigma-70 family)